MGQDEIGQSEQKRACPYACCKGGQVRGRRGAGGMLDVYTSMPPSLDGSDGAAHCRLPEHRCVIPIIRLIHLIHHAYVLTCAPIFGGLQTVPLLGFVGLT